MQEGSLLSDLQTILRTIAIVGFLATGTLIIGLTYRGYTKLPQEKQDDPKYKVLYFGISIFTVLIVMFIYFILF